MSDCWINVRYGLNHFQLKRRFRGVVLERNDFHIGYRDGYFAIYKFFGLERLWQK